MRDPAKGEPRKRITRMRYHVGPMGFLADQIMKEMQRAGYPPREFNLYRSPRQQEEYKRRGTSRAGGYSSAHQYYGASDIIHERWAWFDPEQSGDVPDGAHFWNCIWDCVEIVGEKFNVQFSDRLKWDPAHVQLANWKDFREVVGRREPNQMQLDWYFQVTLPKVWKQHLASKARVSA